MSRQIFLNLAVQDLQRSIDFFGQLGFEFNPQFTDESGTCMVVNDSAAVMLLTKDRFSDFTTKPVADPHTATEAIMCLSARDRREVDQLTEKAIAAGGKPTGETQDHGFMYGRAFEDPDGHIWEVMWMDPSQMPGA